MKDFFHTKGFKILVGIVFIMFGLLLYSASIGNSLTANILGFLSVPMQKVSTVVTNNAKVTAQNAALSPEKIKAENQKLEEENRKLREELIDYYEIKQKNAQYLSVLDLKKQHKDFQMVSGAVIGRDPNDVFYSFSIDQGSLAGISKNDPVITSDGVVGWVSQVYATSSKVTTLFSPETKIGAMSKRTRDSGVISCNIKLADKSLVKLGYLTAQTKIKKGDIITTTGLGGIFPKDLPIGTAEEIKNENYDVSLYATVKPFADVKNLRDVFVITKFLGQGEIAKIPRNNTSEPAKAGGR